MPFYLYIQYVYKTKILNMCNFFPNFVQSDLFLKIKAVQVMLVIKYLNNRRLETVQAILLDRDFASNNRCTKCPFNRSKRLLTIAVTLINESLSSFSYERGYRWRIQ